MKRRCLIPSPFIATKAEALRNSISSAIGMHNFNLCPRQALFKIRVPQDDLWRIQRCHQQSFNALMQLNEQSLRGTLDHAKFTALRHHLNIAYQTDMTTLHF
jgi:hypothetical protein